MATTYEIAEKAGVSQATVSRVLNGSASVSLETKQKVMEWARKLEYNPNRIARSLSQKRSNLLGLIIPDVDNPYFTTVLKAVEQAADLNGYNILLCDSRGNLQKEKQCINTLRSHQVDGILLVPVSKEDSHRNIPKQCEIPVVAITQDVASLTSVYTSHSRGGALVANHFLELGHTNIAFIGMRDDEKCQGLREALLMRGFLLHDENMITLTRAWDPLGSHEVHTKLTAYLERKGKIAVTALFANSDVVAFVAVRILQEHGYAVPDDIAVAGFDNTFLAREACPQLTSVSQPVTEMARFAVEHLLERIAGRQTEQSLKIVLEPTLVIRDSTHKAKVLA